VPQTTTVPRAPSVHLEVPQNSVCSTIYIYNVAYRPVAKRWLCKQQPLLGNARNRKTVFSMCSVPRCYNREVWSLVSSAEFCTAVCQERTRAADRGKTTVGAVTRKRPVTDWEHQDVCSSELWGVEIVIVLKLLVVTTCNWSTNRFTNPIPVYSHTYYVTIWNRVTIACFHIVLNYSTSLLCSTLYRTL
jgi:hypothetical protein